MNQPLGVSSTLHLPESQAPEVTPVLQNIFRTVSNGLETLADHTSQEWCSSASKQPCQCLLASRDDEQDCMTFWVQMVW